MTLGRGYAGLLLVALAAIFLGGRKRRGAAAAAGNENFRLAMSAAGSITWRTIWPGIGCLSRRWAMTASPWLTYKRNASTDSSVSYRNRRAWATTLRRIRSMLRMPATAR
jgi:hypothetical protein